MRLLLSKSAVLGFARRFSMSVLVSPELHGGYTDSMNSATQAV